MSGEYLKLTIYIGERKRIEGRFVADALLDLYGRHELATSVLLRGMTGFGLKHQLRTDSSLTLSEDLPAVAVAVDTRDRIEAVLPEAAAISAGGLVTLERARLAGEPGAVERPADATKLTVYLGRQDRVGRSPAFVAVCDLLHRRGVDGASTLLGVDGTVRGQRQRARFFARNADVPVMVVAVGAGDRIGAVLPELGALLPGRLVTLERVRVCKRDGRLLGSPPALPGTDEDGRPLWQQLMIYTSESQLHHGQPIHRALVQRLRASGASGATTVRGIWGFHGAQPPHGDRTFQFGRRVPAVTTLIDSPERIADSFAVVDELTAEHGLVTSELVPALRTSAGPHGRGGLRLARHRF